MSQTLQIWCVCGRSFAVPSELSHSTVLCPACTRVVYVPFHDAATVAHDGARTKAIDTAAYATLFTDETRVPVEWVVGDVYLGLYEVRELLGAGGMGEVFRVYHRLWDQEIAVKCPAQPILARAGGYELFERECETWVKLGLHPHIVTCYYVRRVGGVPRIFTEYVEGGDLHQWLRDGRLYAGGPAAALERIVRIALQSAWALEFAHSQEIIHRDVKPANILLTADGTAKVTDMGLAKSMFAPGRADPTTLSGMTPAFCSPEQMANGLVTERSDLWSWAVTVLQMFTRDIVWASGPQAAGALAACMTVSDGKTNRPAMPKPLRDVLGACLERAAERRPRGMSQITEALESIARSIFGRPVAKRPEHTFPRAENYNNHAVSMKDLGDNEKAEFYWREALAAVPNHAESVFNAALHHWRCARCTDVDALDQVRRVSAPARVRREMEAEIHLERGDCGASLALLEPDGDPELRQLAYQCRSLSRRPLWSLTPHRDTVVGVRLCRERNLLVTASADNTARVFDLTSGECIGSLSGHTNRLDALWVDSGFTRALTSARDRSLRMWNLRDGACEWSGRVNVAKVHAIAIDEEDGALMAIVDHNRVLRFFGGDTTPSLVVQGPGDRVAITTLSSTSKCAATAHENGVVTVWDTATGQIHHTLAGGTHGITCLTLDEALGVVVAGVSDGDILMWNYTRSNTAGVLKGHQGLVLFAQPLRNGLHVLSAGASGNIRLWETSSGRCLFTTHAGRFPIRSMDVSDDGTLAAVGDKNGGLAVWRLSADVVFRAAPLRLSRGVGIDATITEEETFQRTLRAVREAIARADYDTAERELTRLRGENELGSRNEALALWTELYRYAQKVVLRGHWKRATVPGNAPLRALTWTIGGDRLFGVNDAGDLAAWEAGAVDPLFRVSAHDGAATDVDVVESASLVITAGTDRRIHAWDCGTGRLIHRFEGHAAPVTSARVSPNGRLLLSSGWDLRIWDVVTGANVHVLDNAGLDVRTVRWGPDQKYFVTAGGEKVCIWDAADLKVVRVIDVLSYMVQQLEIDPTGTYAIAAGMNLAGQASAVYVIDLRRGECVCRMESTGNAIRSIGVAADGAHWMVAGQDAVARAWQLPNTECGPYVRVAAGELTCAALAPDASALAVGTVDGALHVVGLDWQIDTARKGDWPARVQTLIAPYLSAKHSRRTMENPTRARLADALQRITGGASGADTEMLRARLAAAGFGWLSDGEVRQAIAGRRQGDATRFRLRRR